MKKHDLTQAKLRRILRYYPRLGNWRWCNTRHGRVKLNSIAGSIHRNRSTGIPHIRIEVHGHNYYAHRLAFFYMKGYWPNQIDHRDGNGLNNRWLNLRECTRSQNGANRSVYKNNKLGIKGVCYHKVNKKYTSQIKKDGKVIRLGFFNTPEAAARAYRKAAKKYHGNFARW